MGDDVVIDDLAEPRFSAEAAEMLAAMASMARPSDLEVESLHDEAKAATGLDDFGPRDYVKRLDILLGALRAVDGLTDAGRVGLHAQLRQLLQSRLLLIDLLRRHPEIHEIEVAPPIIIAGLPRTGTTHLHNVLAADPALRTLPYWESLEPVRLPSDGGSDGRRERTEMSLWFINQAMPLFPLMHEMTTDHAHEEIALLAIDFSTMFFETLAHVPEWETFYRASDQTPHYSFLRTTLAALQWQRGGRRWLLKSPQHLEQLPVISATFPGAAVVLTHRDPASVVVSMATMVAYTARMHQSPVDPVRLGRAWADRIEVMLKACVRDRQVLPADRSMDVRFDDFMAGEDGVLAAVYDLADQPLTDEARRTMTEYRAGHRRGRLGRIHYRAADVGLDLDALRERFAFYTERFLQD